MSTERALPLGCPPDGHKAAQGRYYRLTRATLVVGDIPLEDWRLPLDTKSSEVYQKIDDCSAYAYSLFSDLADLVAARLSVPWAKKKTIAQVDLEPDMGRVLHTPCDLGDSHHDWWPSANDLVPPAVVVEGKVA
jgi:hypothetical protein